MSSLSFPVLAAGCAAQTAVTTAIEGGVSNVFDFSNRNFQATVYANTAMLVTSLCLHQLISFNTPAGFTINFVGSYYVGQKVGRHIDPEYNHLSHKIETTVVLLPIALSIGVLAALCLSSTINSSHSYTMFGNFN